jgi:hypothetical protein
MSSTETVVVLNYAKFVCAIDPASGNMQLSTSSRSEYELASSPHRRRPRTVRALWVR